MQITHLSLTNFRNYERLELDVPAGVTLLHGANAQGKTNLLEAVYYLATSRSVHADHDSQLLNWDAGQMGMPVVVGRLVAQVQTQADRTQIEIRLISEQKRTGRSFRREVLVNRRKVRLMDLLGHVRVVQFLPQDVQLIGGTPAGRRRYMDVTLCQTDPVYCRTLSQYNKVVEQRNATLRQIAEEGRGRDVLPLFTERLVSTGSLIYQRRAKFLAELTRSAQQIHYESLTDGRETIQLRYLPRLSGDSPGRGETLENVQPYTDHANWLEQATQDGIAQKFKNALQETQPRDLGRQRTTVGPHRDDWRFWVNGRDLSSYGSRGQQRTAILALKLGEIQWMTSQTSDPPILLLDEVMAELDEQRRALLLAYIQQSTQAILTATDPSMFTASFLQTATTIHVDQGRLKEIVVPTIRK